MIVICSTPDALDRPQSRYNKMESYVVFPLTKKSALLYFLTFHLVSTFHTHSSTSHGQELTAEELLKSHDKVTSAPIRKYNNLNIFGFVTPWNRRGEQVSLSEAERGRIDTVSPVTYLVTPAGITGGHDYTTEYYDKVHEFGSRVIPRLLFEHTAWSVPLFRQLADDLQALIGEVLTLCRRHKFEGVVIEIWQTLLAVNALSSQAADDSLKLVRRLGLSLRELDLISVLVLPPYGQDVAQHGVTDKRMGDLGIAYSYFVIMTYDFTTPGKAAGPMAPSSWVRAVGEYICQKSSLGEKVLLGINFYGVDFVHEGEGSRHIVGHEIIELVQRYKPEMVWLPSVEEHAFQYSNDGVHRVVFYPSRMSISKRLAVANDTGCGGVAIWDLGQGLDHFFEEF